MSLTILTSSIHSISVGTRTEATHSVEMNPSTDLVIYYVHVRKATASTSATECNSFVVDGNTLPKLQDTGASTLVRIHSFYSTGSFPETSSMTASTTELASIAISVIQLSGADINNPFYALTVNNKTGAGSTDITGAIDHLENNLILVAADATGQTTSSANNPWTDLHSKTYNHIEPAERARIITGYTYPGFTGWNSGTFTIGGASLWKSMLMSINSASAAPPVAASVGFTYDYSQYLAFD